MAKKAPKLDPVADALRLSRTPLAFVGLFSLATNALYLALPLYMAQIYDRVITSGSETTLAVLTLGVAFCFLVQGVLEDLRARVLVGVGAIFDRRLSSQVFAGLFELGLRSGKESKSQALRDLDTVRTALTGPATTALFDTPWALIFISVLFFINPVLGGATILGGIVLLALAVAQDRVSRVPLRKAKEAAIRGYSFTEASLRNAEVVRALGMLPGLTDRWARERDLASENAAVAAGRSASLAAASRVVRLLTQVGVLALGALLVIEHTIGPGILFAGVMLSSRALAPVERVVGSWKSIIAGRQSRERLNRLFDDYTPELPSTALPRPDGRLSVEGISYATPGVGVRKLLLRGVSFRLEAGEVLGVVGPSGAGKSTLVRLLVGIWATAGGTVRLDGADVYAWDRAAFGRHVGYLPQDVELFAGTARDNIARFRADVSDDEVVEAAKSAGVHEMVLRLPQGYDTDLGENGSILSVGQRQRVALARALLGNPSFVVMDEPNANLDSEGEAALLASLLTLRDRKTTVVIVSHRPNIFRHADKILVLKDGQMERFGEREAELARLMPSARKPAISAPSSGGASKLTAGLSSEGSTR